MADSRLLVGLVLSLLLSSLVISLITDTSAAELGQTAIYQPVQTNFTGTNISPSYEVDKTTLGGWTLTGSGLTSTGTSNNVVYFVTKWPETGIYTTTYGIHNPDIREYEILARETNYFGDSIRVKVAPTGVTVQSKALLGYRTYEVFLPANIASYGTDYQITVSLDENAETISISINDDHIGTAGNIPGDSLLSLGYVRYAGIAVVGEGFSVTSLSSTGVKVGETTFDIWSFISSLGGVLAWYTGSGVAVVDLFINLIIKIQQFGIVVVLITIIRGN